MRFYSYFTFLLISVFLAGCANQLPPGGGPVDTVPPEIIEVYPENGTIGFSGDFFELTFSEYVDKRSLKDAIFISPGMQGELELDWSGKSVRVYFPEKLIDSITYTISIGTDVIDYNNRNRMAQSFVFAFSTGDKIDNFTAGGRIYADKPSGTLLFAYRNADDTLNPALAKPDYISQAGTKGEFLFTGLASGRYRIFAVNEDIKDKIYDPEKDKIGVPHTEPVLSDKDTGYTGLNMILFTEDRTSPKLLSASMLDRNHVLLSFSEELDAAGLSASQFRIIDSADQNIISPYYIFKGRSKNKELFLAIRDSVSLTGNYYVIAEGLEDADRNRTESDVVSLTVSDRPDTIKPSFTSVDPAYNSKNVDYLGAEFTFSLDDGISLKELEGNLVLQDTLKNVMPTEIQRIDDASFRVLPKTSLKAGTDYLISFNLKFLKDAAGNFSDSIYVYKFKTLSELDFTGLSGTTQGVRLKNNPKLILESTERKKLRYITPVEENGTFDFKRVLPGKYNLMLLYDRNDDGEITHGTVTPYISSEEFLYHPEEINLIPRWAVLDFIFNAESD